MAHPGGARAAAVAARYWTQGGADGAGHDPHDPPAGRRRAALALALLCVLPAFASSPAFASPPPSRLRLQEPRDPLVPGQQANLTIETVDEQGKPLAATRRIEVSLEGAAALTAAPRVVLQPGESSIEVPIRPAKPGVWTIEASSPGLSSALGHVVCVDQKTFDSHRATRARLEQTTVRQQAGRPLAVEAPRGTPGGIAGGVSSRAAGARKQAIAPADQAAAIRQQRAGAAGNTTQMQDRNAAIRRQLAEEARGSTTAAPDRAAAIRQQRAEAAKAPAAPAGAGGSGGPAATSGGAGGGEVRLIPDRLKRRRGMGGWDGVSLDAFWYEQGKPAPASRDIELMLVAQQGEPRIEPQRLSIASGDFVAQHPATVSADTAGTAVLQALYLGGQSNPVELEFLAPAPVRLAFEGTQETVGGRAQEIVRGFGVVSSQVYLRLLDASGQPVTADQPVRVTIELVDPTGARTQPPVPPISSLNDPPVPLELSRWGTYTVRAFAPGLAEAAPLTIQFGIDWLLIAVALLGGIAGSVARVLYLRPGNWRGGLLRVVALGSVAALIVLMLASFGLLSLLGATTAELQKIPLKSLAGVFLLGFLGGLLFDVVFGRLLHQAVGPPAGGEGGAGGGSGGAAARPGPTAS
jgi:hypothetical protein